jgi:hypothetical protein
VSIVTVSVHEAVSGDPLLAAAYQAFAHVDVVLARSRNRETLQADSGAQTTRLLRERVVAGRG